jgi:glycosyltransferase involved in cell wall biosynthesis
VAVIRALTVLHYPTFGGPHNNTLRLAPLLERHGIETVVALSDDDGDAARRLRSALPVRLIRLSRFRSSVLANARALAELSGDVARLRSLMRAEGIDVVRVVGGQNPQAAVAARAAGIPIVWQISSTLPPRVVRHLIGRYVAAIADVVLTTGTRIIPDYPGLSQARDLRSYVPPVDLGLFAPSQEIRNDTRARIGLSEQDVAIGTVASFVPVKGLDVFGRAAARVARSYPKVRFVIAGKVVSGHEEYLGQLLAHFADLGIEDRLTVLHPTWDVYRTITAFDIGVVSSWQESGPTTLGEMLSVGLPVATTDVGIANEVSVAIPDVVPRARPGDDEGLAAALGMLIENRGRDVASRARTAACRFFSAESCADVFADAYRAAVGVKGRPYAVESP